MGITFEILAQLFYHSESVSGGTVHASRCTRSDFRQSKDFHDCKVILRNNRCPLELSKHKSDSKPFASHACGSFYSTLGRWRNKNTKPFFTQCPDLLLSPLFLLSQFFCFFYFFDRLASTRTLFLCPLSSLFPCFSTNPFSTVLHHAWVHPRSTQEKQRWRAVSVFRES